MPSSSITDSRATTRGSAAYRRKVRRQRKAHRLHHVHAGADQQEGQRGRDMRGPGRPVAVARQQDQREGHDGQAAELHQRSEPDVGYPPPAQDRPVRVGPEADQCAERREEQRQRRPSPRPARRRHPVRRSSPGSACRSAARRRCRPIPGTATAAAGAPPEAPASPHRRRAGSAGRAGSRPATIMAPPRLMSGSISIAWEM